jgi:DNA-binding XRE family transcriptional regulator
MTNTVDFAKIEALRGHLGITQGEMAKAFGVSRLTYTKWTKGTPIRPSNASRVRDTLRKLMGLVRAQQWPTPDVVALPAEIRCQRLLALLDSKPVE